MCRPFYETSSCSMTGSRQNPRKTGREIVSVIRGFLFKDQKISLSLAIPWLAPQNIRQTFNPLLIRCDKQRLLMIVDDEAGFGTARFADMAD
ncbi:hypothetical protein PAECIP111892_00348 [Paenibacillus auburnensis]|uniref:Uncharacterized protein n=1 Tax=Paenibacillus auburnensis TaxID=2905649 RepID=A0ABN8FU30_9BACL|nr:hypothetical protein PAECIP111892_00348 [Paenibacillus auburnensis]